MRPLRSYRSYNAAWEQIKLHVGNVASSHATLARRIASELENPLRSFATSSDLANISNYENNLQSLAETQETAKHKSEKAKAKGKAKKQEEKARQENDARALWETESPLIFEKMQTIDEARMTLLKDIFVKCMMMEVEVSQSSVNGSERVINSLLSLAPAKEVETFVAQQKDATKLPTLSSTQNTQALSAESPPPPTERPAPVQIRIKPPVPEDSGSVRTEKRKSRIGTIFRSSRNSIIVPNLHIRGKSPDRKRKDASKDRAQSLTPVTSIPSQNGVSEHAEPIPPARSSSIANANLEPPRSPTREDQPASRERDSSHAEEGERESILSSESNYAPPLRVEIRKDVIPEEAGEHDAALNSLQTTLRAQSTIARKSRGRRDGRSSVIASDSNEFGAVASPAREAAQNSTSPTSPFLSSRALSPIRNVDSDSYSLSSVGTASRPGGIALHPDLETLGFNISVLETLSAILQNGVVQKVFITGEIALSSHGQKASGINLANPEKFDQIVVNKAILNDVGDGTYSIAAENLPPKGAIALKYKASLSDNLQTLVPLLVRAMWKIEEGSVSLMIGYQLNPVFPHKQPLSNVVLSASLSTDLRITGCQSKPQGQFSRERGQLIWQIPNVEEMEQVVLAKFVVEGLCKRAGTVEAKWECKGVTVSGVDVAAIGARDPFADEGIFFEANVLRSLISGKYSCHS